MTLRATVVADVPSPHQNVFFDAVARLGEVDLEVLFCRRVMPGRAWSGEGPKVARHRFLPESSVGGVPLNPTLLPALLAHPSRLPLLIGYYLPALLGAGLALAALRRPWIFWTDTLPAPREGAPSLPGRLARRLFLDSATLCLSTGEAGRAALLAQGVPARRAQVLPFVVDHASIQAGLLRERPQREERRRQLGIPHDARVLLFVGQMIKRKGIDLLLDALALVRDRKGPAPFLLLLGEGTGLAEFRAQAKRAGLEELVRFLPYVDNAELPRFLSLADGFVLPSRFDAWPVVVVEALVAGLPVVGTDACGSVRDLITPETGFRCAPSDVLSLAEALRAFVAVPDLASMSAQARARVAPLAPLAVAREFTRVLEAAERLHRERSPKLREHS